MCGKSAHIAPFAETAVFRGVAAHYAPFGEGAGKGRRGFALRGFVALDFQLCDSFPALDLECRQTAPGGVAQKDRRWRRIGWFVCGRFSAIIPAGGGAAAAAPSR
jgi:hypothetical protein